LMIELGKQDRASELCALVGERQKLAGDKPGDLLALSYDLERAFRAVRRGPTLDEKQDAKTAEYQQLAVKMFREAAKKSPREAQQFTKSRENMKPFFRLVELDAEIARNPNDAGARISRGRWLKQLEDLPACRQDWDQALELLNAQLESNPNDVALLKDRAWLQLDAGRWDNVVADITAGVAHQPNDFLLLRLRGWANMRLSEWQRAYDDFNTIVQVVSDPIPYWPERIRAAVELGRQSEATADTNALVELSQRYPTFADSLITGFMLQRLVSRFPEAMLALANQAIQRNPKKGNVFRGELGGVQFYLGQYREAIENLEPNAADPPSPSSASSGFWLAMSLHHLGEFDKAQGVFRRAVRNWKGMAALQPEEEKFLQALWSETASLLATEAPATN
jgi:tetratricopeptide (TPR) repeat protein